MPSPGTTGGPAAVITALEERACPLCGQTDRSRLFAESNIDCQGLDQFAFASRKSPEYMHHRLMLCQSCDLLYCSQIPRSESLHEAYQQAAFDSGTEAAYAAATYGRLIDRVLGRLPDRAGALDIGTGDGVLLQELLDRKFSGVVGIEPSAAPIAAASATVRPLIRKGVFVAGALPAESCSLVTCMQTIEHVPDPLSLCREAYQILKPGGALCLVGHNRLSLSARLLGRRSPIFDIEHLQLFSPQSFRELLTRAGFEAIEIFPFWNRYPLAYWFRLFPFPTPIKSRLIKILNFTKLGRIPVPLPAGNLVTIGFRRMNHP